MVFVVAMVFIGRIKWAQEGRGFETKERGRSDVQCSQCRGFSVKRARIKIRPPSVFSRSIRF